VLLRAALLHLPYTISMAAQPLDWGRRRKLIIESILWVCGVVIVGSVLFVVFYKAPTCTDGRQDGSESGVDCGVSCPYACGSQETPLAINFVRALSPQPGRIDIISYINNQNSNASAEDAAYTIDLYEKSGKEIIQKSGTISIPPGSTEPLYIPDFYSGNQQPAQVFLTFATSSIKWLKGTSQPILPTPSNIVIQEGSSPRITATLTNQIAYPIMNEKIVVTVFGPQNTVIAASQTVVPSLQPDGSAPLVFTWNEPFPAKAVRAEILPAVSYE
jgi:hypothetical protein